MRAPLPNESSSASAHPDRRHHLLLIAGSLALLASRVLARQRSFWEWDDYIFGLSLHHFAPQASVPQPPFFPGFVFLGRLARLFLRDDVLALTWVSVLASAASIPLVFAIAVELFGRRALALRAALLFAFFPAAWYYAGAPLSDSAGLAGALLAFLLALKARRSARLLPLAAAAFAIACAIRPQTAFIALLPLLAAFRGKGAHPAGAALLTGGGVLLAAGVLPVVVAAGGAGPVVEMLRRQWTYVVSSPAGRATGPGLELLARRWLVDVWVNPFYAAVITVLTVAGAAVLARSSSRRALLLLLGSFLPYAVCAWIFLGPTVAGRYSLPYLPLHAMLAAAAILWIEECLFHRLPLLLAPLLVWAILLTGPAIAVLHGRVSPPEAAAAAIRKATGGQSFALVYPPDLYVHAELLFLGVPKAPLAGKSPDSIPDGLPVWRFGVGSLDGTGGSAHWPRLAPFFTVGHGRYVDVPWGPWDRSGPLLGRGWFSEERDYGPDGAPSPFHWMGREGIVSLPSLPVPARLDLRFDIPLPHLGGEPVIRALFNGTLLEEFPGRAQRMIRSYRLPPSTPPGNARNELRLETSRVFSPARLGSGNDTRSLGLQLRGIRLSREPADGR